MCPLGERDELRGYQERYRYFYVVIILFFFIIIFRLWFLQIYKGREFKLYAEKNRIWQEKDRAPRGLILDRNGKLLVDNRLSFDIIIRPQYLSDKKKTIKKLASILKLSASDIKHKLINARRKNLPLFYPVVISKDVDRNRVALVESSKLFMPGVDVLVRNKRTYLFGEAMAHVIGYIGEVNRFEINTLNPRYDLYNKKLYGGDHIGKFGVEKIRDLELRGVDGARYVIVDANGRMKSTEEDKALFGDLPISKYEPGHNVILTIDSELQDVAYRHFKKNDKKGAVIALDPRNGEVLVMLSSPSFDPTELSMGVTPEVMKEIRDNPFRPFYNKTIQDHYAPGSAYKPLVALAALEEGVIGKNFKTICRGKLRFGRRHYHCHSRYGHGLMDLHSGIVKSCDIFFYRLGMRLGVDKIRDWAVEFGLSQKTGINLSDEITGLIPSSKWKLKHFGKKWVPGENLSLGIGQSYNLVTPLQLANLYAGIATGIIYKPYVVKGIEDPDGSEEPIIFEPKVKFKPKIEDSTRDIILKALSGVVNERGGTAWWYRPKKALAMAGKTGTVQLYRIGKDDIYKKCERLEETKRHHGWFVGFAPYDKPEIVVAVMAEHSCHGSSGAAPVVRDIIKAYYKKYGYAKEKVGSEEGKTSESAI